MSEAAYRTRLVARRGELLAELFLQDFAPAFLARPSDDLGYDYLMGLSNPEGGMNFAAVQVKPTERPVSPRMPIRRDAYERMAHSNVPVLLLVVDVKRNRLYYAMADPDARADDGARTVVVELTEVDDGAKQELHSRLSGSPAGASVT
jgi:hypothetical protein